MAVLMLFNDAELLTYEDIAAATAIPEDDLKRVLQSLACVKVCRCCYAVCRSACTLLLLLLLVVLLVVVVVPLVVLSVCPNASNGGQDAAV